MHPQQQGGAPSQAGSAVQGDHTVPAWGDPPPYDGVLSVMAGQAVLAKARHQDPRTLVAVEVGGGAPQVQLWVPE